MELINVTDTQKMDKTGPVGEEDDIMFKFVDEEATFPIIMQNLTDPIPKVAKSIHNSISTDFFPLVSFKIQNDII